MKTVFIILVILILTGCNFNAITPYGKIASENDSQIFVYTDSDTSVKEGTIKTDDTTLIIIGVKDTQGVKEIFNNAMNRIKDIFAERAKIYKEWIKK